MYLNMKAHRKRTKKVFVLPALRVMTASSISHHSPTSLSVSCIFSRLRYMFNLLLKELVASIFLTRYWLYKELVLRVDSQRTERTVIPMLGPGIGFINVD